MQRLPSRLRSIGLKHLLLAIGLVAACLAAWCFFMVSPIVQSKGRATEYRTPTSTNIPATDSTTTKNAYSGPKCYPMRYSIDVIDESRGSQARNIDRTAPSVTDSDFRQFVTSVSDYVLYKNGGAPLLQVKSDDNPDIKLLFVRRTLLRADDAPILPASVLNPPHVDGARRLDSPWVKMTISPPPNCAVRATFVWSERQILLDQALMSGARGWPNEPVVPIAGRVFAQFAEDYTNSIILVPSLAGLAGVSRRIPPDVLWLFRHAPQSTRGPFSGIVIAALRGIIERASPDYTNLTMAVIDRGLASEKTEERYPSVVDVEGLSQSLPERAR
jgi:hypothetical protein